MILDLTLLGEHVPIYLNKSEYLVDLEEFHVASIFSIK